MNSIRLHLFLFTFLTLFPTIIFLTFINWRDYERSYDARLDELNSIANLTAVEHSQIVEGVRQLLVTLSTNPLVNPNSLNSGCSSYLKEVLSKYQRYSNLGVSDKTGRLRCSAVAFETPINMVNRRFFQTAILSNNLSVGDYAISPTTGTPSLTFGYPVLTGKLITGVVHASLNLNWLSDFSTLPSKTGTYFIVVTDRQSTVLTSNSIKIFEPGKEFKPDQYSDYIFSHAAIPNLEDNPTVYIGLPKSEIFSRLKKQLILNISVSLGIIIISLISGWYVGTYTIQRMVTQLRHVENLKRDFISLVSHQLRTPLTAIKYFTQILLSKSAGRINNKQREFLEDTSEATNSLIQLVGTLLNLSRFESGKVTITYQPTRLKTIIEESASTYSKALNLKHMSLHIHSDRDDKKIKIDPKLIKQVVDNLIDNAIKYGKNKSRIKISLIQKKAFTTATFVNKVSSTDQPQPNRLFTKFYRSEHAQRSNSDGFGLGLYLSRLIVESHAGTLTSDGVNNGQIILTLTLPNEI